MFVRGIDSPIVIFMPLSPYLCLEFIGEDVNPAKTLYVRFPAYKVHSINECEINSANYSIISNSNFDVMTSFQIRKRKNINQD